MRSPKPNAPEVTAWSAAHSHNGAPEALMVRMCEDLVANDPGVPVDLAVLASLQNVLSVEVADMVEAGCIRVDGDYFRIRLRASDPERRRRFTLAHEICHIFFETTRISGVVDREVGRYGAKDQVEYLCDIGAAELLLPRSAFVARCPPSPGFDDVCAMAEEFDASVEATASRIVALGLGPAHLVVMEPKLTLGQERAVRLATEAPSFLGMEAPAPEAKLRVVWSTGSDWFVPRNKSADDGTALAGCIHAGDIDVVEDPGITEGRTVRVVGRYLPYWRNDIWIDRVIAFLYSID